MLQIKADSPNEVRYHALTENRKAGSDRDFFQIDPLTGSITTGGKAIDYEEHSVFRMQFKATDQNTGLISTCLVEINVKDVNDNEPIFGAEWYEGRVLENSPPNTRVLRIEAHDVDTGLGGEITYSVNPPSDYFTIDSSTGIITTTQTIDREVGGGVFEIDCEARDKGIPPGNNKASVIITVVDDNDNGPVFAPTEYSLTVNEDAPLGKVLHDFTAKDNDEGVNAKLHFFISDGNQARAFRLRTGGELVVDDKLDYETTKEYKLEIIATDGRQTTQPPATVTIKVRKFTLSQCH